MRNSPLLDEALAYWASLRDGGGLPRRSALDPRDMRHLLGHSMILDRVRPGTVRVRLGGQVMQQLMGMEVRGLPIRAFFELADRDRIVHAIEQVFEGPSALELDLISEGPEGLVTARMLLLPLLDAAGRPTKALAVTVTDRPLADGPRRFALTNAAVLPVEPGRVPEVSQPVVPRRPVPRDEDKMPFPTPRPPKAPVEIATGMAEAQTPFQTKASRVPWLRVVK